MNFNRKLQFIMSTIFEQKYSTKEYIRRKDKTKTKKDIKYKIGMDTLSWMRARRRWNEKKARGIMV